MGALRNLGFDTEVSDPNYLLGNIYDTRCVNTPNSVIVSDQESTSWQTVSPRT